MPEIIAKDNLINLYSKAEALRSQGFSLICGIDEAGRGPLAGPVYAAAVILPKGYEIEYLNDSKKLSEKKRETIFETLIKEVAYGIGTASAEEIDALNILWATMLAMERAVEALPKTPDMILIDGISTPKSLPCKAETIVGGDGKVAEIAAASIIAKVSRDRYMLELAKAMPEYEFEKHKGYGTKLHYEKLCEFGISNIHRKSFLKKFRGEI